MKRTSALVLVAALSLSVSAQGIGLIGSAGLEKQISKGFDAGFEAEYRLSDNFKSTDRWSTGVSLSKRLYRNKAKTFTVKASAGYKLIQVFEPYSTKYKGTDESISDNEEPQYYLDGHHKFNLTDAYSVFRHRFTASVQAGLNVGRFKISLRECFQYMHADSVEVGRSKYRFKDNRWTVDNSEPVFKGSMDKMLLRSRIALNYDIPHCKFDPFISYELYSDMKDGFATDKTKFNAGVDFGFHKKHYFELAFIYQDKSDDDEPGGSYLSLGYTFKF